MGNFRYFYFENKLCVVPILIFVFVHLNHQSNQLFLGMKENQHILKGNYISLIHRDIHKTNRINLSQHQ